MTFWRRFWLTITMKHSTIIHVNNYSLEATWLGGCLPRQEIDDSLSLSTSGTLLASWPRLDTSIANVPHFKRRSSEIESVLHLESLCRHLSSRRSSCQPEQPFSRELRGSRDGHLKMVSMRDVLHFRFACLGVSSLAGVFALKATLRQLPVDVFLMLIHDVSRCSNVVGFPQSEKGLEPRPCPLPHLIGFGQIRIAP